MKVVYNKKSGLPIKAIKCSRCKNEEITLLTEYHKSIICRILKTLCLVVIALISIAYLPEVINNQEKIPTPIIITIFLVFIIIQCIQLYIESKTNIQCVCKKCGNYWIHNK